MSRGRRRQRRPDSGTWKRGIGTQSGSVHSDDFDDLAPDVWRTNGPPRFNLFPNEHRVGSLRFNRVEGSVHRPRAVGRFSQSLAPGLSAGAYGGWAWSARRRRAAARSSTYQRGEDRSRRTRRAGARVDERLRHCRSATIPGSARCSARSTTSTTSTAARRCCR